MQPPNDGQLFTISSRIPYLGLHGEKLLKSCISKIQRYFKDLVKFIVIYNTKKISYFTSNKGQNSQFTSRQTKDKFLSGLQ